jgi:hypothetical protein
VARRQKCPKAKPAQFLVSKARAHMMMELNHKHEGQNVKGKTPNDSVVRSHSLVLFSVFSSTEEGKLEISSCGAFAGDSLRLALVVGSEECEYALHRRGVDGRTLAWPLFRKGIRVRWIVGIDGRCVPLGRRSAWSGSR